MRHWGRTADTLHAAALASHAICCALPITLNLLALAFGAGVLTANLPWMEALHDALHEREGLLLAGSGVLVLLGGTAQYLSWRADCGREACAHSPCEPKKRRRAWVFGLVCLLFAVNASLLLWGHDVGRTQIAQSTVVEAPR
ncbi:MAG: hypothetical protein PVI23_07905 [Maricaulaceae bacterium]|jgi:hypothetical protein